MASLIHFSRTTAPPFFFAGILLACLLMLAPEGATAEDFGDLEIHYINVGQGGSTLIIGPDGTTILYDFGNVGRGDMIANYLENVVKIKPADGLDFTIVSHSDKDHYGGYIGLIDAGYNVRIANFYSGTDKHVSKNMDKVWLTPAEKRTIAGKITPIPVGLRIPLGDSAEARVIAANGKIFSVAKKDVPFARNENDRSISLYIKYGSFDFILDGDLGAGREACTNRNTSQKNLQTPVADALIKLGWMSKDKGVDVLHIAHHGSESSTTAKYFNRTKPEVGLISVGKNQGRFRHPRKDVVESVLIGNTRADCVEEKELQGLFQTEEGVPGHSSTGATSVKGTVIGDIKLTTNGSKSYRISGTGRVASGAVTANPASGFWCFPLDDIDTNTGNPCDNIDVTN